MSQNLSENSVLSYNREIIPPWWARWLLRPLGWPYFVSLCLAFAGIIWESRVPMSMGGALLFVLSLIGLGGIGFLRMLIRAVLWKIYHHPFRQFWPGLMRLGIAAAMFIGLYLLVDFEVPSYVAFRYCEPSMRRAAELIIARETARGSTDYVKLPGQSFALYRAFETGYDPKNQVVYFYIEGSGFGLFDKFGWAYSRTQPGAGWPEMGWRHYRGDWYWGGG